MSKEKALKLINEYLAKQEPKKIKLSLVDDLQDVLNVFTKKLNPTFKEINKAKSQLRQEGSQAEKLLNKEEQNIAQALKRIEKSANDLGIDPSSISGYTRVKSLEKIIPDMRVVFKSVQ